MSAGRELERGVTGTNQGSRLLRGHCLYECYGCFKRKVCSTDPEALKFN